MRLTGQINTNFIILKNDIVDIVNDAFISTIKFSILTWWSAIA